MFDPLNHIIIDEYYYSSTVGKTVKYERDSRQATNKWTKWIYKCEKKWTEEVGLELLTLDWMLVDHTLVFFEVEVELFYVV